MQQKFYRVTESLSGISHQISFTNVEKEMAGKCYPMFITGSGAFGFYNKGTLVSFPPPYVTEITEIEYREEQIKLHSNRLDVLNGVETISINEIKETRTMTIIERVRYCQDNSLTLAFSDGADFFALNPILGIHDDKDCYAFINLKSWKSKEFPTWDDCTEFPLVDI